VSINQRILILVAAAVILVAYPLWIISEEMYQAQITKIVDNAAKNAISQTLLLMKQAPESDNFLTSTSIPGRLAFIFDSKGNTIESDGSNDLSAVITLLLNQLSKQPTKSSIISTEITQEGPNPKGWDCVVGFSKGKDVFVAVCYDRDYTYDASTSVQLTAGILALAVFVLGLLGAKLISARITRPLKQLANYARQLPSRDIADAEAQNALTKFKSMRDKDIVELVRALAHMEQELTRYIQNEKNTAAERARIKSELHIAAEIQQGALPEKLNLPGQTASIKAHMLPAQEIGGDLYDYFMVNEHTLLFSLGDVSGKSMPAALFMFATQHMLRSLAMQGMPLNTIMEKLNNTLATNNTSAMYVTMVVGRYDLRTGDLEYILAGHQPPLLKHADGTLTNLEGVANFPVGNISNIEFESQMAKLKSGDRLVVFTDGATEAYDGQNNLYGMKRLVSLIREDKGSCCEELLETVFSSVTEFSEDKDMHDDITVLCLHRKE